MFKLLLLGFLGLFAFTNASNLVLEDGEIKAHTEIFGDSKIDPKTKMIDSKLYIDKTIESLRGDISINTMSLKSDNDKRDEHMHELLQAKLFPTISFKITDIQAFQDKYMIDGLLTLNGVTRPASSVCSITKENNKVVLNGYFGIKLTQFNMEPPSMLFITVRDKIDINYDFKFNEEK